MGYLDSTNLGGKFFFGNHLSTFTRYQGAIAMDFKQAGLSLLSGWIIGVVFMATKLPAPVPPLMGLIGAAGVLLGGYCYEIIARLLMKQ